MEPHKEKGRVADEPYVPELLFDRLSALAKTDRDALVWIQNEKGSESAPFTYAALWQGAGRVAHQLVTKYQLKKGDRALILFEPGLEFIQVFLGCLACGVIAVPLYPPIAMSRDVPKIMKVLAECSPKVILVSSAVSMMVAAKRLKERVVSVFEFDKPSLQLPSDLMKELRFGSGETIDPLPHDPARVAFLQFTSGSTGDPKGVMVSLRNLSHNLSLLIRAVRPGIESRNWVTWLPMYHDMGLISLLATLCLGYKTYLMSPLTFIRNPVLWIQKTAQHRGHSLLSPDFGYGLAARKWPKDHEAIDLSCVHFAGSGAERIFPNTFRSFATVFEPYGFDPRNFSPMYGLAEHTVFVCSKSWLDTFPPKKMFFETKDNRVGCGWLVPQAELDIRIVDSETCTEMPAGELGEIWVDSPSKPKGYWNQPERSRTTFEARLTGGPSRTYLRTGDLGRIEGGQLVVVGRIKDTIIIRAKKYHPEDMESAAFNSDPLILRPGCIAAVHLDRADEGEDLVIMAEVRDAKLPTARLESAAKTISLAILADHNIRPTWIVLLEQHSLPKTSSGKLQRFLCARYLREGKFRHLYETRPTTSEAELVAEVEATVVVDPAGPEGAPKGGAQEAASPAREATPSRRLTSGPGALVIDLASAGTTDALQPEVIRLLERTLGISPIRPTDNFLGLGIDSVKGTELAAQLEAELGIVTTIPDLLESRTVQDLIATLRRTADKNEQNKYPEQEGEGPEAEVSPRGHSPRMIDEVTTPRSLPSADLGTPLSSRPLMGLIELLWSVCSILGLLLAGTLIVFPAWPALKMVIYVLNHSSLVPALAVVPAAYMIWGFGLSLEMWLAKWLIIGRYREGRWHTRSFFFFRWWFVDRLFAFGTAIFMQNFVGTPMFNLWLKTLGTKVDLYAHVGSADIRDFDLVEIGERSTINELAVLRPHRFQAKSGSTPLLRLDSVRLEPFSWVGHRAVVPRGAPTKISAVHVLSSGAAKGSPAESVLQDANSGRDVEGQATREFGPLSVISGCLASLTGVYMLGAAAVVAYYPAFRLAAWLIDVAGIYPYLALWDRGYLIGSLSSLLPVLILPFLLPFAEIDLLQVINSTVIGQYYVFGVLWVLLTAFLASALVLAFLVVLVKWALLLRAAPQVVTRSSLAYYRHWFVGLLIEQTNTRLSPFFNSWFMLIWYWCLGGGVGLSNWIGGDAILAFRYPDFVVFERQAAMGSLGSVHPVIVNGDVVHFRRVVVPRGGLVAMHGALLGGSRVPDGCVVGPLTPVHAGRDTPNGCALVLGAIYFNPKPETPQEEGPLWWKSSRGFISVAKWLIYHLLYAVLAPIAVVLLVIVTVAIPIWYMEKFYSLWGLWALALIPVGIAGVLIVAIFILLLLKWTMIGRFKDQVLVDPEATFWYYRRSFVGQYLILCPSLGFSLLAGCPVLVWLLNGLGADISSKALVFATGIYETDLLHVGADSVVEGDALLIPHQRERNSFAFSALRIGSGCCVQTHSVCMMSCELANDVILRPLALALRTQSLQSERIYVGVPSQPLLREADKPRLRRQRLLRKVTFQKIIRPVATAAAAQSDPVLLIPPQKGNADGFAKLWNFVFNHDWKIPLAGQFSAELLKLVGQEWRMFGMLITEELGGHGLSITESSRIAELLASIDIDLAKQIGLRNTLGSWVLMQYGNGELAKDVLRGIASGQVITSFAWSEPLSASNPAFLQTVAVHDAATDEMVITGEKMWPRHGAEAQYLITVAKDNGIHRLFLVPGDAEGLRREAILVSTVQGCADSDYLWTLQTHERVRAPLSHLVFDRVRVPAANRVGSANSPPVGVLAPELVGRLMMSRFGIFICCTGFLRHCFMLMCNFAERHCPTEGKPLIRSTRAQALLGELHNYIEVFECYWTWVTNRLDNGLPVPFEFTAAAKQAGPDAGMTQALRAQEFVGDRGLVEANGLVTMVRDIAGFRIFEGTSDIMLLHNGASLLSARGLALDFLERELGAAEWKKKLAEIAALCLKEVRSDNRNDILSLAGLALNWTLMAAVAERRASEGQLSHRAAEFAAARATAALGAVARRLAAPAPPEPLPLVLRQFAASLLHRLGFPAPYGELDELLRPPEGDWTQTSSADTATPRSKSKAALPPADAAAYLRNYPWRVPHTGAYSTELLADFETAGLAAMTVPAARGGPGFSMAEVLRTLDQLAYIDLDLAHILALRNASCIPLLSSEAQSSSEILRKMLSSGSIVTVAAPEGCKVTAKLAASGDAYQLDGRVDWFEGRAARWVLVLAQCQDRILTVAVPNRASGLRINSVHTGALQGASYATVKLEGCEIPAGNVLRSDPVAEHPSLRRYFSFGRLSVLALSAGFLRRCYTLMMNFAERRDIGAARLISSAAAQATICEVGSFAVLFERFYLAVAPLLANGQMPEECALAAKALGPETATRLSLLLQSMLGARCFVEANGVPKMVRDIAALRLVLGSSDEALGQIGKMWLAGEAYGFLACLPAAVTTAWAQRLRSLAERCSKPSEETLVLAGAAVGWVLMAASMGGPVPPGADMIMLHAQQTAETHAEAALLKLAQHLEVPRNSDSEERTLVEVNASYRARFGFRQPYPAKLDRMLCPSHSV